MTNRYGRLDPDARLGTPAEPAPWPASVFVAASDAPEWVKRSTPFVCDGVADEVDILGAAGLAGAGKVLLSVGTFTFAAQLTAAIDDLTIEGMGRGTKINLDGSTAVIAAGSQSGWRLINFETDAGGVDVSSAPDAFVDIWQDGTRVLTGLDDPGHLANAILRGSGDYSANETVTIGADVFVIEQIDDDSTDTCKNGSWANTTDPLTVEMTVADYATIGVGGTDALVVGELIYIGTEYLRVTGISGDNVTFKRGAGGSTAASHADTTAIYHDGAGTEAPTKIPVGIQATVTVAAVTPILASTINEEQADNVVAKSLASGATLLVVAADVGAVVLATTETGANLAWDHTAMRRGAVPARRRVFSVALVPDSEEVTANCIYVPLPFDPTTVQVFIVHTANGVVLAWNGDMLITVAASGVPAYIEINNDGAADWDADDTLHILAIE